MALLENICPKCGGKLTKNGKEFVCHFCASTFEEKNVIDAEEVYRKIEEQKQELYSNAKSNLWKEAHEEYLSNEEIRRWIDEVVKYYPNDFLAYYYGLCLDNNIDRLTKFILTLDSTNIYADEVVRFTIKTMDNARLAQPIKVLIEELKNNGLFDSSKYTECMSSVDKVIENLDNGMFDVDLPRDVFVAYSSKDVYKVNEVVDFLEDNGYTCFTAIRNLRHGLGAKENYQDNLKKAMSNTKCIVFVSSENSRDNTCDTMRVELPYYKTLQDKGRVEFLVEEYGKKTKEVSRKKLEDFFNGLEYCRTLDDLALRIDSIVTKEKISEDNTQSNDPFADAVNQVINGRKKIFNICKTKLKDVKKVGVKKSIKSFFSYILSKINSKKKDK